MDIQGTSMSMTRGDTEHIRVNISGYELEPGDYIEFTVRKNIKSPKAMYKKITVFNDNSFVISIEPNDTNGLTFGRYVYDVQLTYSGGVKTIVKPSTFTIGEEVTYE